MVNVNEIVEAANEIVEVVEANDEIVEAANEIVEVVEANDEIVEVNELIENNQATYRGVKFIIGIETIERLGTVGTFTNLMVYLTHPFHMKYFTATIIINIFNGIYYFSAAFGAFFADTFFGRYRAVGFASCSTFLGLLLLTLTAAISKLQPSECTLAISSECDGPTIWQLIFVITSLGFLAVGAGGIRSCNNMFGADQFDPKTDSGREGLKSYSNWYDFSLTLAMMVSQTVIVYVQVEGRWSIGLAIPTFLMFFSSLLFFAGSKHYIKKILDHSPMRVLVSTIKKIRSKLLHRSCNIQQVEEVKCVIKVIPIWVACIIYFIAQVQMGTSSIVQALQTDRRVSQNSNFHIPAATFPVFSLLALTIWMPIYDQIIIPKARKITKTEDGISMLQRLGVGFFLAIITMIISGLVETKRRAIAISQPTLGFSKSGGKISAMSCYWLVPQYAIAGISEGFSIIGQLEFYNKQLPERNFGQAFLYCGFGLSTLLSTFMGSIIHMITKNSKSGGWVVGDLNKGRLEYLYYLIAVLQLLNFVYFLVVAKRYKYIVVESKLLEVKTDAVNLSDPHTIALLPTQETTNLPTTMGSVEVEISSNEAERDEACLAELSQQGEGSRQYYFQHIDDLQLHVLQQSDNLGCLQAQHDELRSKVRMLSEELQLLQEPGSYVGEVVEVIGKSKVLVKVHPEGNYEVDIDKSIDMTKITPSTRVALRNDSYVLHRILPSKVDPWVNLMKVEKVTDSTYDMIGGLDQQIKEIKEVIDPIKHPKLFESRGIAQPKGVLLYGPPGTGKTLLTRAVAHHTDCNFIRVSVSELVGEGSRMVRELFVMAREHAPSIIFMDGIDSIGSARMESGSGNGDSEVQRTMLELVNQLDGVEASNRIKVLMETNRIDIVDQALLRPGRIDRKIEFPNPNEDSRCGILKIHSRRMNLMSGIDLKKIAEKTNGASGAELKAVCTEAGMFALRERRVHVTQEDFEMAVAKVLKKDNEKNMSLRKLLEVRRAS